MKYRSNINNIYIKQQTFDSVQYRNNIAVLFGGVFV